ncbi:hypothetical protein BEI60_03990 [Eisenbergiella tayi]|nr:hypothetical protein BEI60_03990 [Eisenbergiella tayi]
MFVAGIFFIPSRRLLFPPGIQKQAGGGHSLLIIQNLRFFSMQFNKMRGNKKMGVGCGLIRSPSVRVSPRWGCLASLLPVPGRLLSVGTAADKKRGSF